MNEQMITVAELTKDFRAGKILVPALRGVNLTVRRGEFVSVVGPSGCGKSTLLYILGGMLRLTGGSVSIDGFDLGTAPDASLTAFRKEKIGFVFQRFNLIPSLNIFDNLLTVS